MPRPYAPSRTFLPAFGRRRGAIWPRTNLLVQDRRKIWTRSKSGPGHQGAAGPDLVLVGSKSGRATSFFLGQIEKFWSKRPDFCGPGPDVRHLAQRLLRGNSIWLRAAFHLVGGGFFGRAEIGLLTQNRTPVPLPRSPGSATRSRGSAFPILEIFGFRGAEPWLRGRGIPACRSLRPGRICSVPTRPVRRQPVRSREVA